MTESSGIFARIGSRALVVLALLGGFAITSCGGSSHESDSDPPAASKTHLPRPVPRRTAQAPKLSNATNRILALVATTAPTTRIGTVRIQQSRSAVVLSIDARLAGGSYGVWLRTATSSQFLGFAPPAPDGSFSVKQEVRVGGTPITEVLLTTERSSDPARPGEVISRTD